MGLAYLIPAGPARTTTAALLPQTLHKHSYASELTENYTALVRHANKIHVTSMRLVGTRLHAEQGRPVIKLLRLELVAPLLASLAGAVQRYAPVKWTVMGNNFVYMSLARC